MSDMQYLIIEDNPDLASNLSDFFEARGHSVNLAYNGLAGLAFALEQPCDAIVLDLNLPGMDGLEICQRLRAAGNATPVLMLTARDTLDDKLAGFDVGADDYLVKPFALPELEARLQVLVRRASGQVGQKRLRVADLCFELDSFKVQRGERLIELSPIPLRILELLMRRSPAVVTRAELEHAIWGDQPPDSDALRAHIHLLRNAIDPPNEPSLLRTQRGIGYRLAPANGPT